MIRSLRRSREIAILGACAVPCAHPRQRARLDELLADSAGIRWTRFVDMAANENMSGLVWRHLQHASVPEDARTALMGLHLRQRVLESHPGSRDRARPRHRGARGHRRRAAERRGAAPSRLSSGGDARDARHRRDRARCKRPASLRARWLPPASKRSTLRPHPIHHPVLRWHDGGVAVGVEIHWVVHGKWQARFEDLIARAERVDVLGRPTWVPSHSGSAAPRVSARVRQRALAWIEIGGGGRPGRDAGTVGRDL